ncbi:Bile salt-activated lipase [Lachnellula willkommii]|uniref:Carboxylic ester hydrolase n=1 Tax=Lachnellula willkommii TaxID=215461 RepID=A0A559M876_9HELO|nr:Bile salt-activated lipase [Lachnellula willkommii]
MILKVVITVLTLVHLTRSIPSPKGLDSDLTILIDNDILGPQSPSADSGVILLTPRSQVSASAACTELGETLWIPESKTANIQINLDYLTFRGNSRNQKYWIAPSETAARTIDGEGQISEAIDSGNLHLPALCTQSAPFSNITTQDNSTRWQVKVHSNNEFRDRLSFRFLGIRYAPQPKRFTYSTPYKGTCNNSSALSFRPQCIQSPTGGSEDCLFLNIWTPYLPAHGRSAVGNLKPVMFWIYGGGFATGAGNDPTFDGGNIASRGDVVLVTINYRLGAFGFLALNDGVTKGNYGIADAINALDWVRANIHDFGGDAQRITILGQSAGAASVRALLESPKSNWKFQAAIPMSNLGGGGYGTTYSAWLSFDNETATGAKSLLASTNCSTANSQVDCLRNVPATTLSNLGSGVRFPVVDGTYLTTPGLRLNQNASLPGTHLLYGLTRDDGAALTTYVQTTNLSEAIATDGFNIPVATNTSLFPIPVGTNASLNIFNVTSRAATDSIFRCFDQAAAYAGTLNDVFAPNQYFYEFNRSYQLPNFDPNPPVCDAPVTQTHPYGDPEQEYFKCHSGELYYVFGNILRMGYHLRDDNDLRFSQFILDSWTSFARTYNPNPDRAFLKARGFTNTTMELDQAGEWSPITKSSTGALAMRQLQWGSKQVDFRDVEQCAALGWPLDYYV